MGVGPVGSQSPLLGMDSAAEARTGPRMAAVISSLCSLHLAH